MTPSRQSDDAGLYGKYEVHKNGEPVTDCFVLRPDRDQAARIALLAYAAATDDLSLRSDLLEWVQAIQDALTPGETKGIVMRFRESAVADAARKAEVARRGLAEAEFVLRDAQALLARAEEGDA